jgi:hypothetical protein
MDGSDVKGIVRPDEPLPSDFGLPLAGREGAALLFAVRRVPSAISLVTRVRNLRIAYL